MFRALSVGTRVRILEILKTKGPLGAKGIAALLGVTPAAVSQHLKILRQAGLVSGERKGFFIPYSVDQAGLRECGHRIVAVCACRPPGAAGAGSRGARRPDLAALVEYKRVLERELDAVTRRLKGIKGRGTR
jgi:DNA-binding transcriptional ArsR family regulator